MFTMKKRQLSEWNNFVMAVKKNNPEKMFKDVLKLASEMKQKGVKYGDYVKNKTQKVAKKVAQKVRKIVQKKSSKNRKQNKKTRKQKK